MNEWQPTASMANLKKRAEILAVIRKFFAERKVMEVETPLLAQETVTDPYLHSCKLTGAPIYYLQTSPEFAMKRLLAAGSGSIYQICKAFRAEEKGRLHNLEFTMLEWYRVGFTHHDLMNEMDDLLQLILQCSAAERWSYAEAFIKNVNFNPHTITLAQLREQAKKYDLDKIVGLDENDRDIYLQLFMTHCIEPNFSLTKPTFIYDYPITQAALAKIGNASPPVAERFEVYLGPIELANGFHELSDAKEQSQRFQQDLTKRTKLGYELVPLADKLLAALEHGLPACAGVALGIDRLVMLALNENSISKVMSFIE